MTELAATLTPTDDDRLAQAEAWVRSYCGWHIAPSRDETLIVDGTGGEALLLPSLYVTAITSVTEDGVALVENDDYGWSQAGVMRRVGIAGDWSYGATWLFRPWTTSMRGVAVELSHGYDVVPPEVTGVVQAVAARMIANPTGLEQQTVGPFTEKYAAAGAALSATDVGVLDRYRLPWRP